MKAIYLRHNLIRPKVKEIDKFLEIPLTYPTIQSIYTDKHIEWNVLIEKKIKSAYKLGH